MNNDNSKEITLRFEVDVTASLRSGIVPPTHVALPLAAIFAAANAEQRNFICNHLRRHEKSNGEIWFQLQRPNKCSLNSIPTPDASGVLAVIDSAILEESQEAEAQARAEEEKRQRQAKNEAEREEYTEKVRAHPVLAIYLPNVGWGGDSLDSSAAALDADAANLAAEQALIEAAAEPVNWYSPVAWNNYSGGAPTWMLELAYADQATRAAVEAKCADMKQKIIARREQIRHEKAATLLPHITTEERAMFDRNLLDLDTVIERLNDEAIETLEALIEPPDVETTIVTDLGTQVAKCTPDQFAELCTIEKRLQRRCILTNYGVNTTITTADGRVLNVRLKLS